MTSIIIVGAGGFGREVLQWVRDAYVEDSHSVRGFLDQNPRALAGRSAGPQVLGAPEDYEYEPGEELLIAVGSPSQRRRLSERLAAKGAQFHTLVHPLAYVAPDAQIGLGAVVCPFAYVGPTAVVGDHAALNIYSSVGHDARIGACAVLSPYATLNGGAVLDDEVFLGTKAVVTMGYRVGRGARVAAASVVYGDVPAGSLALGNPAKARQMPEEGV